jgi:hypothetical protein
MRIAALVVVAVASLAGVAHADDSGSGGGGDSGGDRQDKGVFGVGIVLGEPTGICAKLYLADDRALAAAVGSAFIGGGIQATADYLFHPYILQKKDAFVVPFYIGPGIRGIDYRKSGNESYGAVGARVVAGILFDFKNNVPIDAFMEAAVVLEYGFKSDNMSHGAGLALNAGAGVRYYF